MAHCGFGCILGSSFTFSDGLELLQKFVGHEVDGGEVINDGLENGDGIANMHPFHAIQARSQGGVQFLVPFEQQIFEGIMLDKLGWLSIRVESGCKTKVLASFANLLQAQGLLFVSILITMPLGQVAKNELQEPANMFSFADGAGEDDGPETVVVEESIVE